MRLTTLLDRGMVMMGKQSGPAHNADQSVRRGGAVHPSTGPEGSEDPRVQAYRVVAGSPTKATGSKGSIEAKATGNATGNVPHPAPSFLNASAAHPVTDAWIRPGARVWDPERGLWIVVGVAR